MSPWNSTFTKPGKPLAKRSAKRVSEDAEFAKVQKAVFERDGHACQFPWVIGRDCERCWGELHPHHIVPVGRDKTLRLELTNIVSLCARHHDEVHANPLESSSVGLLKSAPLLSPQPNQGQR